MIVASPQRAFARHPIMPVLTVILLCMAATRIFYMVLHDPMFAYANQFDAGRTAACLNLWPELPGGPRDTSHFDAPIKTQRLVSIASQDCYPSAEALVDWVALRLDGVRRWMVGVPNVVDMRVIGLLKALLLIATACVVTHALRRRPPVALGHALIVLLVLADPLLTLYLNTLYGEFVAAWGAYAALAGLVGLVVDDESRWRSLAVFTVGVLSLAFSRMQHVLLPLFFVALLAALVVKQKIACASLQRTRWLWASGMIGLVAASVGAVAMNVAFVARNPVFHEVNRSNMLFGAVLPASHDPSAAVAALGLPPHCVQLVNSGYWRIVERGRKGACSEALAISPMRLLMVLASDPTAIATLFGRGLVLSSGWRIGYLGEVAHGTLAVAPAGPLGVAASIETVTRPMGFVGHAIFWLFPLVVGLMAGVSLLRRQPAAAKPETGQQSADVHAITLFALAVAIASVWGSTVLGDGYSELARHLHLGILAALASWVVLLMGMFRLRRRRPLALLAVSGILVGLLISLLFALPLSVGALAEPHDDRALTRAAVLSGWAIAPKPVVAVEIEQGGRVLHRAPVRPSITLGRYYPMGDGGCVFEFSFARSAILAGLESAVPLRVFALNADETRQLIDVRYP